MWINTDNVHKIVSRISTLEYTVTYLQSQLKRKTEESERANPFWDKVLAHIGVKCEWIGADPGHYELVVLKKKRGKK